MIIHQLTLQSKCLKRLKKPVYKERVERIFALTNQIKDQQSILTNTLKPIISPVPEKGETNREEIPTETELNGMLREISETLEGIAQENDTIIRSIDL